jgi:hypothetical protein
MPRPQNVEASKCRDVQNVEMFKMSKCSKCRDVQNAEAPKCRGSKMSSISPVDLLFFLTIPSCMQRFPPPHSPQASKDADKNKPAINQAPLRHRQSAWSGDSSELPDNSGYGRPDNAAQKVPPSLSALQAKGGPDDNRVGDCQSFYSSTAVKNSLADARAHTHTHTQHNTRHTYRETATVGDS